MTEIELLREEIAKLRERVAVLEARPQYQQNTYWHKDHTAPQPVPGVFGPPPWKVTCGTVNDSMTWNAIHATNPI